MIYNDVRKNENKGFSLVELIVVVAIMAVLVAVLAPSLLAYVERSRAQKDDSAMSEVTNAIQLALADQDVYDEVLVYTCKHNFSCYVDTATAPTSGQIETKNEGSVAGTYESGKDQYIYGDETRIADETPYHLAGDMRGVTITFSPSSQSTKKSTFILSAGVVNKDKRTAADYINGGLPAAGFALDGMSAVANGESYLYNRVRATVGDKVELTSQTYRNSDYTVFIRMGTTGGAQTDKQDAIKVYGQWGGTNLKVTHVCVDNSDPADQVCDLCGGDMT